MKKQLISCLTAAVLLGATCGVYAAPSIEDQETEIASLKERLAAIESELQEQKTQLARQRAKQKKTDDTIKKSKEDDLKFYGDARIRSIDSGDGYKFEQRVRLNIEKKLNKDALFRVRGIFMNENEMGTTGEKDVKSKIDNAYMQFNNLYGDKNSSIKLGRFGHSFGKTGYWSSAGSLGMYDGLEFTTGKALKISAGFGDWGGAKDDNAKTDAKQKTLNKLEKNVFVKLGYNPSKATSLQAWHIRETNADASPVDYEVTGIGVKSAVGKNLSLAADYSKNVAIDGDPDGKFIALAYGKASYNKPHSYEARLYYADVDKGNVPGTLNKSVNIPCNDVKGPGLSLHYAISKGVMAEFLTAFNMEQKSTGKDKDDYYRFQVSAKF